MYVFLSETTAPTVTDFFNVFLIILNDPELRGFRKHGKKKREQKRLSPIFSLNGLANFSCVTFKSKNFPT